MKFQISATGNIVQGRLLDVARAPLEAMLRDYDPQLYVKWNPKKLRGLGCWEIRRRPEMKTVLPDDVYTFEGNTYVYPKYNEQNLVHHVLDVEYLNYGVLGKLKRMDTWATSYKGKSFNDDIEYAQAKYEEKIEEKAHEDKEYMIKQHKTLIRDFMDYTLSGGNPYRIADYWGKGSK